MLEQDRKSPEFATQANNTVVGAAGAVVVAILAATLRILASDERHFSSRVVRGKTHENA